VPERWTHTGYTQRLHFGAGALDLVADLVKELGVRKVLLVSTEGRLASGDGERLVRRLGRVLFATFGGVRPHVPTSAVEAAVRLARRDAVDGLVSFGGGSSIDLAKAVSFFLEQEAGTPGASYVDRPALLHVAIPTTYSGAEITPYFGMTDERTRTKTGAGSPTVAPIAVLYDPQLTLDTPHDVTAQTAMNALAHCVEAAYATVRSPEAEAIALAGAERIVRALPVVAGAPADLEARATLLEGAALAGRALLNASMGVHHGLAQLLGGRTGLPHGLANALLLPHAMRFNAAVAGDSLARIGAVLGDADDPAGAVERLRDAVGLPGHLGELSIDDSDLDDVARLAPRNGSVQRNPRPVTEADARAILDAAW
jgi:maleylacetate reductase